MLLFDDKQIVLSHVDLRYDDHLVLSDVSIEIFRGDFALIVGPNGGGKTSLLRVILGLLRPDEGTVVFYRDGTAVSSLDIGYLPQKSRIDSRFPVTVAEVVAMGLIGKKLSRKDSALLLDDMLARVGLSDYAATPIGELSGGQLQRVHLARVAAQKPKLLLRALFGRALITNPEVLILDEPTSYVDRHFGQMMIDLLREANRTATILLVTHEAHYFDALATQRFRVHKMVEKF